MANRKAVFKLMLGVACTAVILWLGVGCGEDIDPDYQCGTDSMRMAVRTHEALVKYYPLIMRLPHDPEPEPEFLRDENGELTDTWGIVILTDEEINQDSLYARYGIPDSIGGVSVQVLPREIGEKGRQWYPGWRPDSPAHPHFHLMSDVGRKNRDLIRQYPFFSGQTMTITYPSNDPGNSDRIFGIRVHVSEKVDPDTLLPENRISDCLDDVPVEIFLDPSDRSQITPFEDTEIGRT